MSEPLSTAAQLERAKQFLGSIPGAAERAMARALNAAVKAASEEALTKIAERYAVKRDDVEARFAQEMARPAKLSATLRAKSPALPLHYFPHTPTAPGTGGRGKGPLSVTIRAGSPQTMGSAFIAQLGVKPRIVIRTGQKTASGKDQLKVLYSTPIAVMLGVPSVRLAVEERALEVLDDKLTAEIDRELGRAA